MAADELAGRLRQLRIAASRLNVQLLPPGVLLRCLCLSVVSQCVKDASSRGLTKAEKKCVKQCTSRYYEGYEIMLKHFAAKQQ